MAPTAVSAIEISMIGPYPASEVGRLKIPTPTMEPITSAGGGPTGAGRRARLG